LGYQFGCDDFLVWSCWIGHGRLDLWSGDGGSCGASPEFFVVISTNENKNWKSSGVCVSEQAFLSANGLLGRRLHICHLDYWVGYGIGSEICSSI
jgi:hypothetical protein